MTQQARTLTATVATLDADPPVPAIGVYGVPVTVEAPVASYRLAPERTLRSGTVTVGSDTGDTAVVGATQVPVWLDPDGNPADPPLDSAHSITAAAASLVVVSAVGAWFMVGVILWTAWLALAGGWTGSAPGHGMRNGPWSSRWVPAGDDRLRDGTFGPVGQPFAVLTITRTRNDRNRGIGWRSAGEAGQSRLAPNIGLTAGYTARVAGGTAPLGMGTWCDRAREGSDVVARTVSAPP